MEEDALRASRVLEDGVHGGDRAAKVHEVESDCHVDVRRVADAGITAGESAFVGVTEYRRLSVREVADGVIRG